MSGFTVREGGADNPAIVALIAFHLNQAGRNFPAGFAHALEPAALLAPDINLFSLWEEDQLAGIGALRPLSGGDAEIKTMRTAPAFLGRGVGRAILHRLIDAARSRGIRQLSLETGTGPPFAAAHGLYESAGFVDCAAFGGYRASPHNRFMTLTLQPESPDASADPHPPRPVRLEPGKPLHRLVGRRPDRARARGGARGG